MKPKVEITESKLAMIDNLFTLGVKVGLETETLLELARLARLGLWAEKHGIEALKSAEEEVHWEKCLSSECPSVEHHLLKRVSALAALPKQTV